MDLLAKYLGEAGAYTAAVGAASKLLKSSTIPIGSKIALSIGAGAGSLVTFKLIQNAMNKPSDSSSGTAPKIIFEAEKVSSTITKNSGGSGKSSDITCPLEANEFVGEHTISSQWVDQLQLMFELQSIICYLLLIVIIIFFFKLISEYNFTYYIRDWPILTKILTQLVVYWKHTNNIWIILGLFFIFIFSLVNLYSLWLVLKHIS